MQISLQGRVALVTGGSRGIGRAIAIALAEAGADVAVNYRRDEEAANETVEVIKKLGRKAKAYAASVENFDEDQKMVADVLKDFGSIGILVNNAGIASRGQTVAETDPQELERVLRVHAMAPHFVSKLVVPHMRKERRGDIVIISSVATLHMAANGGPYNMGKAAAEALALTLAKEERKYGIRTNIVAPSLTDTDMGRRLAAARMGKKEMDIHELDDKYPFGHVCSAEEVAAAVVYLVSDANPYANGQKLNIDGGGN
ncbi:SDR family NAD(P)-dependent oxidoreductase [Parvibaculum sp.]|uniref:SDR family NAD(P)-dependent oxidoreductase n=1 Tax=Parvibaculum sp. TaxID=2024848 RepID=UPI002B937653|nr:SDR family oxidoreductase [Parvibaculum sp.]HUD52717.1 SDR family oxidoreductase [Parvibaculum sp.]